MLLECPNCATHFRVPPQALGDVGRTVRCSRCAFEWFAEPRDLREAKPKASTPEVVETPAIEEPAPEEFSEDILSALGSINIEEAASAADSFAKAGRNRSEEQKKPAFLPAIIAAAVALLVLVAGILLYFNEPLRKMGLGGMYDTIGIQQVEGVKLANLSLTKLKARRTTYAIAGNVVNTSKAEQPIPAVRIRVVDETGKTLREWEYAQEGTMKPGQVLPFSADKLDCAFLRTAHSFIVDIGSGFDLALRD